MIYCLDANVLITAWNTSYPQNVFPTLYTEMEKKLPDKIILIKPIFDEIDPIRSQDRKESAEFLQKEYPLSFWLEHNLKPKMPSVDGNVEKEALSLINAYQLSNVASKGADFTDAKLIAYASVHKHTVVTLESEQNQPPNELYNYKIPLICKENKVACIDFVKLLENCGIKV